jgi:nitrite reductase (cytochrome c-552)
VQRSRWGRALVYVLTIAVAAVVTFLLTLLLMNIQERKQEAKEHFLRLVDVTEDTVDPKAWGQNFPRQYDSYRRPVDVVRTRHGGSDAYQKLDEDPRLKLLYAGYAFSLDFREERGHAFMLKDQDETERVKQRKQPGACLHCHSSVLPAYRAAGGGDVMKGFEILCAMDWTKARKLVSHPVSCVDCHDPMTNQLRVTRPAFLRGIQELAKSTDPLPHLPSIVQWRKGGEKKPPYDVNALATRQEMRSFVCGQCHVEYYFKGKGTLLTYPWSRGLKVEQIEEYYDAAGFHDWVHGATGAKVLKAQHPEFEMWNQGIHARSGVSCADCHMPYVRDGAVKVTDHQVRSPLLNVARACQTCHRSTEDELKQRAELIQGRTSKLLDRATAAIVDLIRDLEKAGKDGRDSKLLGPARAKQRAAQWRLDFVSSENSMGFHASQESARILAEAIDEARQGQLRLRKPEAE